MDVEPVLQAAGLSQTQSKVIQMPQRQLSLDALLHDRITRLSAYQNAAYAQNYERFVRSIADTEKAKLGCDSLAREIATSLYKLMAYKDEHEVARLYVDNGFIDLAGQKEWPRPAHKECLWPLDAESLPRLGQAIEDFKVLMRQVIEALHAGNHGTAMELARLPQTMRGFGHIKERNAQAAELKQQRLFKELHSNLPENKTVAVKQ